MAYLRNPYGAERNIMGRSGRVLRNGVWLANATGVTATIDVDRQEIRRSGTYWVDYKAGEYTGTGTLTIDKVNSDFEREFIAYLNGENPDGTPLANRAIPAFSLQINLEDRGIPGITYDANGEATAGHESITLYCVRIWGMGVGFDLGDMVTRDYDFTFSGISLDSEITEPVTPPVDNC